jgi:predicted ATPase
LDLTQEQLAKQVGCSVGLIRKIEGDERRPSRQIAELLASMLQIPVNEHEKFVQVARAQLRTERLDSIQAPRTELSEADANPMTPAASPPLPRLPIPPTPLIGRSAELAELNRLLADPACRLLTLVGPGGIGKTRLALAVATNQATAFAGNVGFVALASLSSSEQMAQTIAAALGLTFRETTAPRRQLLNLLRPQTLLLLLDNLEHLLDDITLLAEILAQAPGIKLLVTSRERLNLQGEWVFDVHGLSLSPAGQNEEAGELAGALALFVERARRVSSSFALTAQNRAAIARICQLVEGMPLGIELAAAWVPTLSCLEIAQEIERNLDFLTAAQRDMPARHRSMRAVFDYSWKLLTDEEGRVLSQLTVFHGGFQRDAAARVAGASLPLLAQMASKSLIQRAALERDRHVLHELVRQYGADKLSAQPDQYERTYAAHSAYYLGFVQERERQLQGSQPLQAIAELHAEMDNIRAAWRWAVTRRQVTAVQKPLKSLWFFFEMRGWREEAAALFAWALGELAPKQDGDEQNAATWLRLRQHLQALEAWFQAPSGRLARSRQLLQESVAILRAQGLRVELADLLYHVGVLDWMTGDFESTLAIAPDDPTAYAERGAYWGVIRALNLVGQTALAYGDQAEARRVFGEAHRAALEAQILPAVQDALLGLAQVQAAEGTISQALEQLTQILEQPATLPETRERARALRQKLVGQ